MHKNDSAAVLYLGDTSLTTAAAYLAGVMSARGLSYEYVPSEQSPSREQLAVPRKAFIISDYSSHLLDETAQQAILGQVAAGAGLVMLGGWESYKGLEGDWGDTLIGRALPVEISAEDDRCNYDQAAVIVPRVAVDSHPILAGAPWLERPPLIGGFNLFRAKRDSVTLLEVWLHETRVVDGKVQFNLRDQHPMLVVGSHGKGRVACLATDAAPHWVGPFVDWGTPRVRCQGPGAIPIEVGCHYAQFLQNLISWVGQM